MGYSSRKLIEQLWALWREAVAANDQELADKLWPICLEYDRRTAPRGN